MALTRHEILRGLSVEKPLHRTDESFRIQSVPDRVTVQQLVRSYLCLGIDSPCRSCQSLCRYGREWLQALDSGNVPEKYKKEVAAQRVREAKARMRTPDLTADLLREKGERLNDPDLIAAAMVVEELSDQNENKRKRLEKAAHRLSAEKKAGIRRMREALILLTAYTGYRLVPFQYEDKVLKTINDCLGVKNASLDLSEEEHGVVRAKLRNAVGEVIARAFGQATEEEE